MAEEFEGVDLSQTVFWGVTLDKSLFRDATFGGAEFFHVSMTDVRIDGVIDGLIVNGVDVTDFVNSHDRWYPLRTLLEPADASQFMSVWSQLKREWELLIARARSSGGDTFDRSVGGEWSLRDTLRHLVFAREKWFHGPFLGSRQFTSFGLPNTGSRDFGWPGLDLDAEPDLDDVLARRESQDDELVEWIESADFSRLPGELDVMENGSMPTLMCLHAVLEEEFEHLRYMVRDLGAVGI